MNNKLLSVRQAILWFVLFQIGSGFIILPTALARIAKQDSWLSVICAVVLTVMILPLFVAIAKQMNGKSFLLHMEYIVGKWTGRIFVSLFVIVVPFLIFSITLRNLSDFITSSVAQEMPIDVINVIMIIAVYFAVRSGAAVIGRSAELLFFLLPVLYVIVTVSVLFDIDFKNMLPILEYGFKPVVKASIPLFAFPYLEIILFLFFVPHLAKTQKWGTAVLGAIAISGIMYFGVVILTVADLTEGVTASTTYSTYFVVRTISVGSFFKRFEVIVTLFWYITIFFRLCLLLYVTSLGLSESFRLKESNMLLIPLLLIGHALSIIVWPSFPYFFEFLSVWPSYAMLFGLLLPILIWLIGAIKKRVQA